MSTILPLRIVLACAADFQGCLFGGTESLIEDLLRDPSTSARSKIAVVGLASGGEAPGRISERIIGGRVFNFLPVASARNAGRLPLRLIFAIGVCRYRAVIRGITPHVLYAHGAEGAIALRWACPNVPIVMHVHGTDNPLCLSRFSTARLWPLPALYDRLILRPALRDASGILANLDAEQLGEFRERYAGDTRVSVTQVRAGVDLELFHPTDCGFARVELGISNSETTLIFAGRLEPPKGVHVVIQAVRILAAAHPNIRLLVVGDGSARRSLIELSRSLGISERIVFVGKVSRARIPVYLSAADIFVTGTVRESISMALLEALACGVPAVCGPVGGAREVLSDPRTGLVVDEVSPATLAHGIGKLLPVGESARGACVAAARRFSASRSNDMILDLMDAVGRTGIGPKGR